tara:strand:+ start:83 stop:250 length:168 start_codon:yes stop_codon:yes gene_type:complete
MLHCIMYDYDRLISMNFPLPRRAKSPKYAGFWDPAVQNVKYSQDCFTVDGPLITI